MSAKSGGKTNNYIEVGDELYFHPGYYVKEYVESSKATRKKFLSVFTEEELKQLVKGNLDVTREIAEKLSSVTKVSPQTWLNFQVAYNKGKKRLKDNI